MASRKSESSYKPNVVPRWERIFNSLLGTALLLYGLVGLITERVDLNGSRMRIAILEGRPALLMASAFIVGAVVLLTVVIDHYDNRNNERHYRSFRWAATRLAWCLAASALISHFYLGFAR